MPGILWWSSTSAWLSTGSSCVVPLPTAQSSWSVIRVLVALLLASSCQLGRIPLVHHLSASPLAYHRLRLPVICLAQAGSVYARSPHARDLPVPRTFGVWTTFNLQCVSVHLPTLWQLTRWSRSRQLGAVAIPRRLSPGLLSLG